MNNSIRRLKDIGKTVSAVVDSPYAAVRDQLFGKKEHVEVASTSAYDDFEDEDEEGYDYEDEDQELEQPPSRSTGQQRDEFEEYQRSIESKYTGSKRVHSDASIQKMAELDVETALFKFHFKVQPFKFGLVKGLKLLGKHEEAEKLKQTKIDIVNPEIKQLMIDLTFNQIKDYQSRGTFRDPSRDEILNELKWSLIHQLGGEDYANYTALGEGLYTAAKKYIK